MTSSCLVPALAFVVALTWVTGATAQIPVTGSPTTRPAVAPDSKPPAAAAPTRPSGDSDTMLADVADTHRFAVGVVVIVLPGRGAVPIGTAWAFESNLFATNGHVIAAIEELAKKAPGAPFYVAINQRPDKRLKVLAVSKHPQYGVTEARFDGKTAISAFDLGVIRTAEAAPQHFTLASREQLQGLRAGVRIAFLGFPMESLVNDNIDTAMPIATMQSGIVTSISDNFLGDSGFANNRLVRHNLPSAGGASGSPIFTPDGRVVAILWGGNAKRIVATKDGAQTEIRQGSAAMINFAERIDGLTGVPRP